MPVLARPQTAPVMVATTHTDLIDELGPDLLVKKRFHDRVEVERPNE